jgi:Domain of unknown function (DUF2760)
MMAIGIAFRAFFAALFNRQAASRIAAALSDPSSSQSTGRSKLEETVATAKHPERPPAVPVRSEALTLLSTLQREARLIDLICEPLEEFSDAQIGAAAREVLRDSQRVLDRLFSLAPLSDQDEGSQLAIPDKVSPVRLRLVGKSQGQRGVVVHRGWKANACELPIWQGDKSDAMVLAPTEVEVS